MDLNASPRKNSSPSTVVIYGHLWSSRVIYGCLWSLLHHQSLTQLRWDSQLPHRPALGVETRRRPRPPWRVRRQNGSPSGVGSASPVTWTRWLGSSANFQGPLPISLVFVQWNMDWNVIQLVYPRRVTICFNSIGCVLFRTFCSSPKV